MSTGTYECGVTTWRRHRRSSRRSSSAALRRRRGVGARGVGQTTGGARVWGRRGERGRRGGEGGRRGGGSKCGADGGLQAKGGSHRGGRREGAGVSVDARVSGATLPRLRGAKSKRGHARAGRGSVRAATYVKSARGWAFAATAQRSEMPGDCRSRNLAATRTLAREMSSASLRATGVAPCGHVAVKVGHRGECRLGRQAVVVADLRRGGWGEGCVW